MIAELVRTSLIGNRSRLDSYHSFDFLLAIWVYLDVVYVDGVCVILRLLRSTGLDVLATTLNRLERSIKSGIYTQSLRRQDKLRILVGTFLTQGKASSIPTVFSWGDSISPEDFLPSILLLLVIIVVVVIVVVMVILVVVVGGEDSSIIKHSL
ncbi:hypothetical protein Tco_1506729, partial [Tanacetum coccineum]